MKVLRLLLLLTHSLFFLTAGIHTADAQSSNCLLRITDLNNAAIEDASVYLLGQNINLDLTNRLGQTTIPCEYDITDTLVIQKIGFQTLQVPAAQLKAQNNEYNLTLESNNLILDEVQVVGRSDWSSSRFAQKIEVLDAEEIESLRGSSTADLLESSGEVFVQRSQLGGGSPIIRGFEANRILLVVDGVRLNNAIYRSGHLHNSLSVDQFILQNVEIHSGPNSLLYGSDALGGVLHFKTKNAQFSEGDWKLSELNASSMFQSSARAWGNHLDLSFSQKRWSTFTSISFQNVGDMRSGSVRTSEFPEFGKRDFYVDRINGRDSILLNSDPNILIGSGFQQLDLVQKINYRLKNTNQLGLNLQYSSAPAPRYDQLSEISSSGTPTYAEWDYAPQNRFLAALHYDILRESPFYDRGKVIGSFQRIEEGRQTRFFNSTQRFRNSEDLLVGGLTMDFVKNITWGESPLRLYYGGEIQSNTLESTVTEVNIETGQSAIGALTRYPSNENNLWNGGMYAMLQKTVLNDKLNLEAGIRHSAYRVNLSYLATDQFDWPMNFIDGVTQSGQKTTFSGSLRFHPNPHWTIQAMTATAFRAPNIDDIAKIRIKNGEVLAPNLDLQPESAWNNELLIGYRNDQWHLQTTFFATELYDLIARRNGNLPNGDTIIVSDGQPFRVQVNDNLNSGRILGWSIDAGINLTESFKFKTGLTKIIGEANPGDDSEPLAHIPPLYGKVALSYDWGGWRFDLFSLFNGPKPLSEYAIGGSDNEEFATADGTLSWWTLNSGVRYERDKWSAALRIDNMLDRHYRTFASGISASGFNVVLQFNYHFIN